MAEIDASSQRPGHHEAEHYVHQAKSLPLTDGGLRTAQLLSQALAAAPDHHDAQILQERLYQMCVPRWHFAMLADKGRNAAYAKAIEAAVNPGDVVLDIGCGAGLTAMLAARAGAGHVYACEQQPLIAQAAIEVIAANGLSDRITVIPKLSHTLVVGEDIPQRADVVISEIVDTVLLGEGALATLVHAMSALAKPQARAVPQTGVLKAQLVQSDPLVQVWRPQEAEGFDLSAFHRFASVAQMTPSDFAAFAPSSLGPAVDLFEFDFTRPTLQPAHMAADLICRTPGMAHGVMVSFEMELAPGISLSNGVEADGHWGRSAYLLDRPQPMAAGDRIRLTAQHDCTQLSIAAQGAARRADTARPQAGWLKRALEAPERFWDGNQVGQAARAQQPVPDGEARKDGRKQASG